MPARPTVDPIVVSSVDAAAMLGVSQNFVERLAERGVLPTIRLGRAVRYRVVDVRALVDRIATNPEHGRALSRTKSGGKR
jgi:excisionase family DNA binding protein